MANVTNKELANFFGYSAVSISTFRNSKDERMKARYEALCEYYLKIKKESK